MNRDIAYGLMAAILIMVWRTIYAAGEISWLLWFVPSWIFGLCFAAFMVFEAIENYAPGHKGLNSIHQKLNKIMEELENE